MRLLLIRRSRTCCFSCRACHCGPPPRVFPAGGELNCRPCLQCWSRAWKCQDLPHCPALSMLGSLSSSSPPSVSTDFVCPARLRLVSCQKFCVCCPRLCPVVPDGAVAASCRWCDVPEHLAVPWVQGEEPLAAAAFHHVRGELGTCSSLAGRRWPLASGFSHVGLLGRWFLAFVALRLVIRV